MMGNALKLIHLESSQVRPFPDNRDTPFPLVYCRAHSEHVCTLLRIVQTFCQSKSPALARLPCSLQLLRTLSLRQKTSGSKLEG